MRALRVDSCPRLEINAAHASCWLGRSIRGVVAHLPQRQPLGRLEQAGVPAVNAWWDNNEHWSRVFARIHRLMSEEVDLLPTAHNASAAPASRVKSTTARTARTKADKPDAAATPAGTRAAATKPSSAGGYTVTVTLPVEQVVAAANTMVRVPVNVARRVIPTGGGMPVYLGLGGLAVVGAVEWPLAAAAGLGFAALRRWGPLRPAPAKADTADDKAGKSAPPSEKAATES
jgi:hypothetical protein